VSLTRAPLAALAAGLAALAAGCGSRDEPSLTTGKDLFVSKCASCHTLSRANARGVQGPNLDAAFRQARADGFGTETVKGIVRRQIAHPRRGSIMPAGLVKGTEAQDVAAYVASAAGQPGKDSGALATAGQPKASNKTAKAKGGQLDIDADPSGALAFTVGKATAPAGSLKLVMKNAASIQHDIALKQGSKELGKGPVVGKGGTSSFSTNVKAGKYEFFCSVPGHEAGGMKGTLTVK